MGYRSYLFECTCGHIGPARDFVPKCCKCGKLDEYTQCDDNADVNTVRRPVRVRDDKRTEVPSR